MAEKRKDKARTVLKTGEVQRKNGTYQYSWMDGQLKRRFIYAKTLADLREKEKNILKDKCDGIKTEARYTTVNDLFDLWLNLKRGLKNNTLENYKYLYNTFVRPVIGNKRVSTLRKSDVKKYYNYLADERNLKVSTIDSIHTVLHQILQIIAAFTNQKSLIIGSIGLFLYFAFVEFATEACISLCTDVRAEIRGTVIGSSFGALAIGSTIGTGVSPVLYTKFGYTPCIIVGTVIVAIALLVIAKVLTPGFANKEKN